MKSKMDVKSLKPSALLPIVAIVLVLIAGWEAFTGWQVYSVNQVQKNAEAARHKVVMELQPQLGSLLTRAGGLTSRTDLATAIRSGNNDAAKAIVMQAMPGTESSEVHSPGFAQAYVDPTAFGFGKLGLMERALQDGKAVVAVV